MTLTELRTAVYGITNRPDLVSNTFVAIQHATLQAHQSDYYYRDLFESGLQFSSSAFLQQFEYGTLVPRWRSLKYLRKFDATATPAPGVPGKFFDILTPDNILDGYSIHREDVCYIAGSLIQIRSSTEIEHALFGCYLNPDITENGYNSWIAVQHPFAIVFEAAALVFKGIGKMDEMSAHRAMAAVQYQLLQNSNILAEGY